MYQNFANGISILVVISLNLCKAQGTEVTSFFGTLSRQVCVYF
jgi:hypothetical protein